MSDQINSLIHSNARLAFDQGVKTERQRIIRLLEQVAAEAHKAILFDSNKRDNVNREKLAAVCYQLIDVIKGEQK